MAQNEWKLVDRQGLRELWRQEVERPDGTIETTYLGREYLEIAGEREKVDEERHFHSETDGLGWLSGASN